MLNLRKISQVFSRDGEGFRFLSDLVKYLIYHSFQRHKKIQSGDIKLLQHVQRIYMEDGHAKRTVERPEGRMSKFLSKSTSDSVLFL